MTLWLFKINLKKVLQNRNKSDHYSLLEAHSVAVAKQSLRICRLFSYTNAEIFLDTGILV